MHTHAYYLSMSRQHFLYKGHNYDLSAHRSLSAGCALGEPMTEIHIIQQRAGKRGIYMYVCIRVYCMYMI